MYHKDGNTYRNAVHYRLHKALCDAAKDRIGVNAEVWIKREREILLGIVNDERRTAGNPPITLDAVERVEQGAVGHSDYGTKFALYCSELVEPLQDPEP